MPPAGGPRLVGQPGILLLPSKLVPARQILLHPVGRGAGVRAASSFPPSCREIVVGRWGEVTTRGLEGGRAGWALGHVALRLAHIVRDVPLAGGRAGGRWWWRRGARRTFWNIALGLAHLVSNVP